MSRTAFVLLCLAGAAACSPAQAAAYACQAQVAGPARSAVRVTFDVDKAGKVQGGEASWLPPHEPGEDMPWLMIDYRLNGSSLGPAFRVRAGAEVDYDKGLPKSQAAHAALDIDGRSWQAPWPLFAARLAQDRARAAAGATAAAGFWGVGQGHDAPEAGEGDNADLVAAVTHAAHATLRIEGDGGETFGSNTFDLTDPVTRDRLFKDALAQAEEAAKTPGSCPTGDGA